MLFEYYPTMSFGIFHCLSICYEFQCFVNPLIEEMQREVNVIVEHSNLKSETGV